MRRFLVLALFVSLPALAGTYPVFPQRDFVRATASPSPEIVTFTVKNPALAYRLRLVNGGAAANHEQLSAAIVKLNGTEVLGTSDFSGKAPLTFEKPVTLLASNELSVELRGNPGAGATIAILGVDDDLPAITAVLDPPANAAGWNSAPVTVTFTCSDATTEVVTCSAPAIVSAEGSGQNVTGTATDLAGNTRTVSVTVNIDKTPPVTAISAPASNTATKVSQTTVTGSVSDALSGLTSVACNGIAATVNGSSFTCHVTLINGANSLQVAATDKAGNASGAAVSVLLDTTAPVIELTSPASGFRTNLGSTQVTGRVSDDDTVASVTLNGQPVTLTGTTFDLPLTLTDGANNIIIAATDRAGNTQSATRQVTRFTIPNVAITAPADLATLTAATVNVSGSVSVAGANVVVNGIPASVTGNTFTAAAVPLAQGRTVITATATTSGGAEGTASVLVYRDSIPPRVVVRYPADGARLYAPTVDVTGMVDDIVVGTINSAQMRVSVNGINAEVANRGFLARNVPLTPGANTLNVTATDAGGNSVTLHSSVTYDASATRKIVMASGNNQSAVIDSVLPARIAVRLVNADGSGSPNQNVVFEVVQNNGVVSNGSTTNTSVIASTDGLGNASVLWRIGERAGVGNNRVLAHADGFAGTVEFQAAGLLGAPHMIVVDSGNSQFGATGSPLPRPLVAIVVDAGNNRVAGVPVTFSVEDGGGSFNAQPSVTVITDTDGRAWATPSLGGGVSNAFTAALANDSTKAVTFVATGRVAGPPAETKISGVILDNTDSPIPGVSVRIDGTTLVTRADAQGQFTLSNVPVGYVKLFIDGSTSLRPGSWPTLEYAMFTIAGVTNTLDMPIHILPIDQRRGLFVDETTGGTLTIPELPGFALTIKPGSATFPGGSRTGTVSVTLVHADKVPMAPGFGQQPRFIVTIQPPGVHFDPPAPMSFPNVDGLAPGAVSEMYSFDHDLGQFVSIGTASVSADGTYLRSDEGVGIIKGGWHCGGDPAANGSVADCPECKKCINNVCKPRTGPTDTYRFACCNGVKYSTETQCCVTQQLVPAKPWRGWMECPQPGPSHTWSFQYDGCSIPGWLTPNGVDKDNPAGGDATQFSKPDHSGPCDVHDQCYQTCNPEGRDACDSQLLAGMLAVCNADTVDALITILQCKAAAYAVYEGVHQGGWFAFWDRQTNVCDCCDHP